MQHQKKLRQGTIEQKIGDFWFSGMDSAGIEQQGLKPLEADLLNIGTIKSVNDLDSCDSGFTYQRTRCIIQRLYRTG